MTDKPPVPANNTSVTAADPSTSELSSPDTSAADSSSTSELRDAQSTVLDRTASRTAGRTAGALTRAGGGTAGISRAPRPLLDVRTIYAETAALALPRGRQVLQRWPDAAVIEVPTVQRIPSVHGEEANVSRWVRTKTEVLALGVRKTLTARRNERSANWIAPSTANGCAMACAP